MSTAGLHILALWSALFIIHPERILAQENSLPMLGAQVFIEPGQKHTDVDQWFRLLKENGMRVCRIRMFEQYMHKPDGSWDYSLFDSAFAAADKYGIRVFATLFPSASDNSVGGFKFPESEEHLQHIASYIEHTVSHFRQYPSMYAWVLQNEPGTGGYLPDNAFTRKHFDDWKRNQSTPVYNSQGYPLLVSFDKERFLVDYETWFLNWIADEVHKYDPGRQLHVNNHQVFQNVAEYDFPAWRKFLSTLGASAHASWHFGYFRRNQYALAMSANCDIIRSGAGNIPFWVTEMQGGNNTYSGNKAFCPTSEEITQWLWTSIGAGSRGIIFWCLNPRSIGEEAGEWALLDFQNQPSDRMQAAARVSATLADHAGLFSNAVPVDAGINLLYAREALWVEKKVQFSNPSDIKEYEGRMQGGVMKSILGFYQTLAENGIAANIREMDEFDWSRDDYTGVTIILANQVAVPSRYWDKLDHFVKNGGKLIVEGISFFYDENMLSLMNTGFPLARVMGGTLSEVKCTPGDFFVHMDQPGLELPIHLWKGYIHNESGKIAGSEGGLITATRNQYGKGVTLWIPSLVGMGAWRNDDYALSSLLRQELAPEIAGLPVRFAEQKDGMMMRTLQSGNNLVTILINKSKEAREVKLQLLQVLKGSALFQNKGGRINHDTVTIEPEETMVIEWTK